MYKCERCGEISKLYEPQAKIKHYRENGSITREEKVCFECKIKEEGTKNKK